MKSINRKSVSREKFRSLLLPLIGMDDRVEITNAKESDVSTITGTGLTAQYHTEYHKGKAVFYLSAFDEPSGPWNCGNID